MKRRFVLSEREIAQAMVDFIVRKKGERLGPIAKSVSFEVGRSGWLGFGPVVAELVVDVDEVAP